MIIRRIFSNKMSFNINDTRPYSTSSKKLQSSFEYCVDLVKKLDYENFLSTILLPKNIRNTAFVIRAFNVELSKIQENVTEARIGPMRIKFWDDCIDNIYKDKPEHHPIIKELYNATKRHKLSKMHLKRLITARSKQLNNSSFRTLSDMESYADQTTTPVYMLLLEAAGAKSVKYDHVASHFGKSQGLANLIRSVPHNLQDRLLFLPLMDLAKNDISEEDLFRGKFSREKLSNVVYPIATLAYDHLRQAAKMHLGVPKEFRPIFLPSVSTHIYLKSLEEHKFDVFEANIQKSRAKLPFMLLYYRISKQFLFIDKEPWLKSFFW